MEFGRPSRDYAAHRKGFAPSFFARVPLAVRVLDLGAGTGTLAKGYRERGAETVALDLSLPMLRAAQSAGARVAARAKACFNPAWAMAGGNGLHEQWRPQLHALEDVQSFFYDEAVEYSREAWRGRMRACNGALAVRDETARARLDQAIGEMLAALDEPLLMPHRIFVISGRKRSGL